MTLDCGRSGRPAWCLEPRRPPVDRPRPRSGHFRGRRRDPHRPCCCWTAACRAFDVIAQHRSPPCKSADQSSGPQLRTRRRWGGPGYVWKVRIRHDMGACGWHQWTAVTRTVGVVDSARPRAAYFNFRSASPGVASAKRQHALRSEHRHELCRHSARDDVPAGGRAALTTSQD